MKKIITGLALVSSILFSSEYYAKIEPINTYNVKSSVAGKITFVNNDKESKTVKSDTIVKIDSKINKIDLKQSEIKLSNLKEILKLEQSTLESYKKVSSKSKFDKDNQKIKILNIISSISDLETKIATLEDTISNKTLIEKNRYIYNIAVEVADYVNPGTLLYSTMDLSKGKLEIFIPISQADDIKNKTIYIDGAKTDLTISKLYTVADTKHISSYKCEIIIPTPEKFSKLVKIEFK
ncbi:MAG: hypothetical protein U9R37_07945 [Campylobacterota bacterium]|nr:hypothetical protein [Campylobacterota bacterium]